LRVSADFERLVPTIATLWHDAIVNGYYTNGA
jgi:hypothetical protein